MIKPPSHNLSSEHQYNPWLNEVLPTIFGFLLHDGIVAVASRRKNN